MSDSSISDTSIVLGEVLMPDFLFGLVSLATTTGDGPIAWVSSHHDVVIRGAGKPGKPGMLSDCGTAWILPCFLPQAAVAGNSRNCYCYMHCCDCHQRSRPLTHFQPSLASLKHTPCMGICICIEAHVSGSWAWRAWLESHTRGHTLHLADGAVDDH